MTSVLPQVVGAILPFFVLPVYSYHVPLIYITLLLIDSAPLAIYPLLGLFGAPIPAYDALPTPV